MFKVSFPLSFVSNTYRILPNTILFSTPGTSCTIPRTYKIQIQLPYGAFFVRITFVWPANFQVQWIVGWFFQCDSVVKSRPERLLQKFNIFCEWEVCAVFTPDDKSVVYEALAWYIHTSQTLALLLTSTYAMKKYCIRWGANQLSPWQSPLFWSQNLLPSRK